MIPWYLRSKNIPTVMGENVESRLSYMLAPKCVEDDAKWTTSPMISHAFDEKGRVDGHLGTKVSNKQKW